MSKLKLLSVLFLSSLFSCNSDNCLNKSELSSIEKFNKISVFTKDIPLRKSGEPDYVYQDTKNAMDSLGFEKIDSGYKNFQIRILGSFDSSETSQVLSIKLIDKTWEAKYYRFLLNSEGSRYKNIKIDSLNISPKTGWCIFIHDLFSQNILYLPTIDEVPGFMSSMTHGSYVFFEIASGNHYRFYYYQLPINTEDEKQFEELHKVSEILKIIKSNFNLKSS